MIYEFRTSALISSGSTAVVSLNVHPGLCRQAFAVANTSSTVFRMNITDYKGLKRQDWGFQTGMLNDNSLTLPVQEKITVNITNASQTDTFSIYLGIEEKR